MHLIDGSKGKIRCDDGEQITVVVAPNAGVAAVRYSLDGKKWGGGSFPVNQANPPHPPTAPLRALAVAVVYSGDIGGAATLTVTGSSGGDTSVINVTQAQGEVLDMVLYRFYI
ncbi:MAG: hypothetical protein LC785_07175 [Acidobacteria bacterium]|nr:hypothetical protein [Acidobacteriota bacterium]